MADSERDTARLMSADHLKRADALCRRRYVLLGRRIRRRGLIESAIDESRRNLTDYDDTNCTVKPRAYKPTGVALGCPLPDTRVTRLLHALASRFDALAKRLLLSDEPLFAYVPSDWYHITLVNKAHFDISGEIVMLSGVEMTEVAEAIRGIMSGPVHIVLKGLLLTAQGRLEVTGMPGDSRIHVLRDVIVKASPNLRVNLPVTYHIKLGHLLRPITGQSLSEALCWLSRASDCLFERLTFHDCYTPAGRIEL